MAPRQAAWAKDPEIIRQYTVLRRPAPQQQYQGPAAPMGAMGGAGRGAPAFAGGRGPIAPLRAQYTGMGEDGRFQKNNPTGIVPTSAGPQTVHEGELMVQVPGNRTVVLPASGIGQKALKYLEKQARLPGMADGGTYGNTSGRRSTAANMTPTVQPWVKSRTNVSSDPLQAPPDDGGDYSATSPTGTRVSLRPAPIPASSGLSANSLSIGQTPMEARRAAHMAAGAAGPTGQAASRTSLAHGPIAPIAQTRTVETPTLTMTDMERRAAANRAAGAAGPTGTAASIQQTNSAGLAAQAAARGPVDRSAASAAATTAQTAAGTPPQPVAAAPANASTIDAQGATDQAFQYMIDTMNGMNPRDKAIAEYYLGSFDVSSAASQQAMMNRISRDPSMSEGAKRQMIAGLERSYAIGRGQMGADLAINQISRADAAARDVFRFGRELTTYEDQQRRNAYNDALQAGDFDTAASIYQQMTGKPLDVSAMREDRAYLQETRKNQLESAETNLGITRYNQAVTMVRDGIPYGDGSAFDLNNDGAPDIDEATYNAITAGLDTTDPYDRMNTLVQGGRTLEQALGDQTLRAAIGRELNTKDDGAIDAEIAMRWETATKPLPERLWEKFNREGLVPPEYSDTPGIRTEFESMVRDLVTNGMMDADGNLLEGAMIEWPWNNPETFYNYTDWNNADIDYEAGAPGPETLVDIPENGTQYVNGSGGAVTFADMETAWKDTTNKEDYFTGGRFDRELFMKDKFRARRPEGEGAIEFDPINNEDDLQTQDEFLLNYVSAPFPDEYVADNADALGGEGNINVAGLFGYYDHNGVWQHEPVANGTLAQVWLDFSEKYGNGEPLSLQAFNNLWKNGVGWVISPDGHVMNFDADFQQRHGLSGDVPRFEGSGYGSNMIPALNAGSMATIPQSFGGEGSVLSADNATSNTNSGRRRFAIVGAGVGVISENYWYNNNIYGSPSGYGSYHYGDDRTKDAVNNYVGFKSSFVTWANENAGNVIQIGDKYYRLAEDPVVRRVNLGRQNITSGNDSLWANGYADGLRLIDVETGDERIETFGATYALDDGDPNPYTGASLN